MAHWIFDYFGARLFCFVVIDVSLKKSSTYLLSVDSGYSSTNLLIKYSKLKLHQPCIKIDYNSAFSFSLHTQISVQILYGTYCSTLWIHCVWNEYRLNYLNLQSTSIDSTVLDRLETPRINFHSQYRYH